MEHIQQFKKEELNNLYPVNKMKWKTSSVIKVQDEIKQKFLQMKDNIIKLTEEKLEKINTEIVNIEQRYL